MVYIKFKSDLRQIVPTTRPVVGFVLSAEDSVTPAIHHERKGQKHQLK